MSSLRSQSEWPDIAIVLNLVRLRATIWSMYRLALDCKRFKSQPASRCLFYLSNSTALTVHCDTNEQTVTKRIVIRRGKENVVANNSWKPMVAPRNKLRIRIRAVRRRYCVGGGGGGAAAAHGSSSDCFPRGLGGGGSVE